MIQLSAGVELDLEGVRIQHQEALGDGYMFSWMFEGLGGASFMYSWDMLHPEWKVQDDGSFGYDLDCPGNREHPLRVQVRLRAIDDSRLNLTASLHNLSERYYTHCWADVCLLFKHAPRYADSRGERCILHTAQGLVPAERWPRTVRETSWSPQVQAYRLQGFDVPYPYGVVQGLALWSVSPAPVQSGCVMMARDDGQWHIGLAWDRVGSVAHNADEEHHCIHSDPWFGTVPPGSTVTRRGVLLFIEGAAEDLLGRYLRWRDGASQNRLPSAAGEGRA
jgi:hypothetical protein